MQSCYEINEAKRDYEQLNCQLKATAAEINTTNYLKGQIESELEESKQQVEKYKQMLNREEKRFKSQSDYKIQNTVKTHKAVRTAKVNNFF